MPNAMVAVSEKSAEAGLKIEPDSASSAVVPVMMVRDSRSFSDRLITSASGVVLYFLRFSRSRSKLITFSFIE